MDSKISLTDSEKPSNRVVKYILALLKEVNLWCAVLWSLFRCLSNRTYKVTKMAEKSFELSLMEKGIAKVLSQGPVPKHVALVLDGHRRWARQNHVPLRQGHNAGYHVFLHLFSFLAELGVEEVTGFVLSVGNLSRSKEEIDALMDLFDVELGELIKHLTYKTTNVRFRFMGQMTLLSESIQRKCAIIEEQTKNNKQILNMATAYACQDDITQAMKAVLKTDVDPKAISMDLLENKMFFGSNKVDLYIRTSGETRLSDFMMWEVGKILELGKEIVLICSSFQSTDAWICFIEKKWPEMNFLDVTKCILKYQRFIFNNKN